MSTQRIAVIAGDGIGKETMPEGLRVLGAAATRFGIALAFDHFGFSNWDYFERHGQMLPEDWKEHIGGYHAIFLGAVGWPAKVAACARTPRASTRTSAGACTRAPSARS